jgi:hypothetical protein
MKQDTYGEATSTRPNDRSGLDRSVSVLKLLESLESFVIERTQSDSRGAADVDAGKPTEIYTIVII